VLKNNRGVAENRVRHLDYGVQINKLLYQRLIQQKDITLFSPSDVPGLYDAFFSDQQAFERLYTEAESNSSIRQKKIKAVDLFSMLLQERAQTGRIYIQHVDHCNEHSPFDAKKAPIKQSNLCMEITLPTKPLQKIDCLEGEIALCTLSAFNLGAIKTLNELEKLADLAVRALDSLLDYQDYPLIAAKIGSQRRRNLGIGVINFAYYLAKNNCKYSDGSANDLTHQTFEAIQYYLLKASNQLAKEKGACEGFSDTTYAQGILPIDTYKTTIDHLVSTPLLYDWKSLRESIKKHGLRHSTLSALMPSETSSQISNATNGIEPPRAFVSIKQSKDGVFKQVVPSFDTLQSAYELRWNIPDNKGYLELCGIMQKFVDQSISTNLNYDPKRFESGKVPMKQMMADLILSYQLGLKTLYYHNTRDGSDDEHTCESGACKI
jgi:ribonucleoside-diphosphate reductase alpha chain